MTSYGNPSATSKPVDTRTNGLAIASLICGIVGLLLFNVILGPIAIVLGVVSLKQAVTRGRAGMAKAGIILGIIDLVIFGVLIAAAASNGGLNWYVGG
jgi:hypothetical protein